MEEETACEIAGQHDHGKQLARMWRRNFGMDKFDKH